MSQTNQLKINNPGQSLVMTDYFFLFGMWLAIFWADDPFGWRLEFATVIKHFPIVMITPAFLLVILGKSIFKNIKETSKKNTDRVLVTLILLFSSFVTIGSMYGRFVSNIDNGFLTMGLYALTAPLTAWFVRRSTNPDSLIKATLYVYVFWAGIAIIMQTIHFKELQVFHAREHLVIACLAIMYFVAKSKLVKFLVILLIAFAAFVGQKNTGYMIGLLIFSIFFMIWAVGYAKVIKDKIVSWIFWLLTLFIVIISVTLVTLIYVTVKDDLPTGNPEYRLHTYEAAWDKFLSSPVWGNGYTKAATEKFELFTVSAGTQVLPTHSDPLDIIANGGLIGFFLWISIFIWLFRRWYRLLRNPDQYENVSLLPYMNAYYCMIFSGVVVCAFNPILNTPNSAWAFWVPVGMFIIIPPVRHKQREIL